MNTVNKTIDYLSTYTPDKQHTKYIVGSGSSPGDMKHNITQTTYMNENRVVSTIDMQYRGRLGRPYPISKRTNNLEIVSIPLNLKYI